MEEEKFKKLVEEGIKKIPEKFRKLMENVAIVIQDVPTESQLKKVNLSNKNLLLGLYEGVPKTKRGDYYANVLPDKITIFKKNIERVAKTDQEIEKTVTITVWHEIAHHFGLNEKEVRDLERKKFK